MQLSYRIGEMKKLHRLPWLGLSIRLSIIFVVLLVQSVSPVETSAQESQFRRLINCKEYWAKLDGVPAYTAPDEASEVVAKLPAQERVCVIGERGEFLIFDWNNQQLINDRSRPGKGRVVDGEGEVSQKIEIAYGRKVDFHEPQELDQGVWAKAKRHIARMRGGVVPEDIYGPFRPVIDQIHPPTTCLAGKEICEKVEAELEKYELEKAEAEAKLDKEAESREKREAGVATKSEAVPKARLEKQDEDSAATQQKARKDETSGEESGKDETDSDETSDDSVGKN